MHKNGCKYILLNGVEGRMNLSSVGRCTLWVCTWVHIRLAPILTPGLGAPGQALCTHPKERVLPTLILSLNPDCNLNQDYQS